MTAIGGVSVCLSVSHAGSLKTDDRTKYESRSFHCCECVDLDQVFETNFHIGPRGTPRATASKEKVGG